MTNNTTKVTNVTRTNTTHDVNDFMARLEHPLKAEIEAVRASILGADLRIREEIKWNAPSFFVTEHFATFKLRPFETVQVIFHTGAKRKPTVTAMEIDDPAGLLKWVAPDRCIATFSDIQHIKSTTTMFVAIVQQWGEQM